MKAQTKAKGKPSQKGRGAKKATAEGGETPRRATPRGSTKTNTSQHENNTNQHDLTQDAGGKRAAPSARSLANLRPWQPGQSANPGGRPRLSPIVRKKARLYTEEALELAMGIARDEKADPFARLQAIGRVLETGWGKVPEAPEDREAKAARGAAGARVAINVGAGGALAVDGAEAPVERQARLFELLARGAIEVPAALPGGE